MPYSEHQAERIRVRLNHLPVVEKKMMGGLIFMVRNAMCVGIDIDRSTAKDRLMVRVGKRHDKPLLSRPGSRQMDFTGTVLRGFLFVDADAFDLDEDLDFWINQALEFNLLNT